MLQKLNMIRVGFSLSPITELAKGETNREIVENSLSLSSNLKFGVGTNWIDVDGEIYSNRLQPVLDKLESNGFIVWTSEGMPVIQTPNEIADFLKQD